MSQLQPDERLCPFCAETVKRAAIKCRWCGSELEPEGSVSSSPGESPSGEREPAASATQPAAVAEAEQPEVRSSGAGTRTAVLLVALICLGALAVFLAVRHANSEETAPDGTLTSNSARAVAMQRAAESTAKVLSYKAETFDADAAEAGKLMTSKMRTEYLRALEPVKADVVKNGIVLKATVVATSLVEQSDDTVEALLFVNQSTTATGASQEQLDNNRVLVTMQRDGDSWLISKIKPF